MRAIWQGNINFGLVNIGVKLYPAIKERKREIQFHLIHKNCLSRIEFRKYCPNCQQEVEIESIRKGYEIQKGKYILFEEKDFENLPIPSLRNIQISNFLPAFLIDPRSISKSYLCAPEENSLRAFSLLREVMKRTKLIAIGRLTIRQREHLVSLQPFTNLILVQLLYYPDETVDDREIRKEIKTKLALSEKEIAIACDLVRALSTEKLDLRKREFQDNYRKALEKMIKAKATGKKIRVSRPKETKEANLMEVLKKSIEKVEKKRKEPAKTKTS